MTDIQLKQVSEKLLDAYEAHLQAATLYREAFEFALPLVGGKPELLKNARRAEIQRAYALNEMRKKLKAATPKMMADIFKGITGEA